MKKKHMQKNMEMGRKIDYTTGNLLDYEYFSKHYRLIAMDFSRQIELENLDLKQQINFISRLDKDNAVMFFSIKRSKEATFDFSQNSVISLVIQYINPITKKIVNLSNGSDNESSNFATRKWYVINGQITQNMVKEMKMIQA